MEWETYVEFADESAPIEVDIEAPVESVTVAPVLPAEVPSFGNPIAIPSKATDATGALQDTPLGGALPTERGVSLPFSVPPTAAASSVQMGAAAAATAYLWNGSRWREFLPVVPLFSRLRRERLLDHPIRQLIYGAIRDHAGIHYRELLRRTHVSNGTLSFHLRHLERAHLIRFTRVRGRKHFYLTDLDACPAVLLVTSRQRQVLDTLREAPGSSQKDIATVLGMSRSSASYHVAALRALGLVETQRVGGAAHCYLRET